MGAFIFDGQASREFHVQVERFPNLNGAKKRREKTSISGKSGDLIEDDNIYENTEQPYEIYFSAETEPGAYPLLSRKIRGWLLSVRGYARLEDSYDTDYFRLASFEGPLEIENIMNLFGRCTLTFDCKPFRYRKSGEKSLVLTSSNTLYNPERFPSKPYIKIVGNGAGTLMVGSQTLTLKEIDDYLEIDCEMMNCFKGTELRNSMVSGNLFPELLPGKNGISWTGNISRVEIKPRWCTL